MTQIPNSHQTAKSVAKNVSFFRDNLETYGKSVKELDTYAAIRSAVNESLRGVERLLDIGNGGVFDYDVSLCSDIVALDLFLDEIDASIYPPHIKFKTGSALNIPESSESFDGVLMVMLLHHLVGKTVGESISNARSAINEALRVLKPGGRLIIIESCVPWWSFAFERLVFPVVSRLINLILPHPVTIQYPVNLVASIASDRLEDIDISRIAKGRWVLQYGYKFPSFLTPISPYRLVIHKFRSRLDRDQRE